MLQDMAQLRQVGLFGLGGPAPEEPDTSGRPLPAEDKSTAPPKAFKGQPVNDSESRDLSDTSPSDATRVRVRGSCAERALRWPHIKTHSTWRTSSSSLSQAPVS